MNQERAKALIPILEAYAQGKTVQRKSSEGEWRDVSPDSKTVMFLLEQEHRIKPELNEIRVWLATWVETDPYTKCPTILSNTSSEKRILDRLYSHMPKYRCVEILEVLE